MGILDKFGKKKKDGQENSFDPVQYMKQDLESKQQDGQEVNAKQNVDPNHNDMLVSFDESKPKPKAQPKEQDKGEDLPKMDLPPPPTLNKPPKGSAPSQKPPQTPTGKEEPVNSFDRRTEHTPAAFPSDVDHKDYTVKPKSQDSASKGQAPPPMGQFRSPPPQKPPQEPPAQQKEQSLAETSQKSTQGPKPSEQPVTGQEEATVPSQQPPSTDSQSPRAPQTPDEISSGDVEVAGSSQTSANSQGTVQPPPKQTTGTVPSQPSETPGQQPPPPSDLAKQSPGQEFTNKPFAQQTPNQPPKGPSEKFTSGLQSPPHKPVAGEESQTAPAQPPGSEQVSSGSSTGSSKQAVEPPQKGPGPSQSREGTAKGSPAVTGGSQPSAPPESSASQKEENVPTSGPTSGQTTQSQQSPPSGMSEELPKKPQPSQGGQAPAGQQATQSQPTQGSEGQVSGNEQTASQSSLGFDKLKNEISEKLGIKKESSQSPPFPEQPSTPPPAAGQGRSPQKVQPSQKSSAPGQEQSTGTTESSVTPSQTKGYEQSYENVAQDTEPASQPSQSQPADYQQAPDVQAAPQNVQQVQTETTGPEGEAYTQGSQENTVGSSTPQFSNLSSQGAAVQAQQNVQESGTAQSAQEELYISVADLRELVNVVSAVDSEVKVASDSVSRTNDIDEDSVELFENLKSQLEAVQEFVDKFDSIMFKE